MRRCLDVVVAAAGLVLGAPLLLAAALSIILDSGLPVLFRQRRVGQYGAEFELLKLRTMSARTAGPAITIGADPRITRTGRWLRATRIDEVPQLVNVLRAEMSLVGPRPEVPQYVHMRPELYAPLLRYRPGLTDPASLSFLHEADILAHSADPEQTYLREIMPRKAAMSLDYARAATWRSDLGVLVRTVRSIAADREPAPRT